MTHLCEKKLKELGVYGSFKNNLKEIFLDLIPLDHDLLSMENSQLYKVSHNINLFKKKIAIFYLGLISA